MGGMLLVVCLALGALPGDPGEALYLQGVGKITDGQLDSAAELFRRSLDESPDGPYAPSALLMWGDTERKRDQDARAIELYAELIERFPTHRLARTAEARQQRLEHLASLDEVATEYWAILEGYDGEDTSRSVERMEALLAAHADHEVAVDAACWLGSQYRLMGDFERAATHYEAALDRAPDAECNLRGLEYIAIAAMERGELNRARDAIEQMRALGEPGLAAYDHHQERFVKEHRATWIGRVLGVLAGLGLLVLMVACRERRPRMEQIRVAAVTGGAVLFTFIGAGLLGGSDLRALLFTLGAGLAGVVVFHGLRRRRLPRLLRWIYLPALASVAVFVVFSTLRLFDRI